MKTLTTGLLAALVLCSPGWTIAAEAPSDSQTARSPVPSFLPGPPLWQRPELRPKARTTTDDLEQVVDQCVTDAMEIIDTPGASVAVIVDGDLVYEQGYGVKRRGGSDPVNAETQFRIGSVTKMFTAAAVMQQVEAGTVFLDDPVTRHVPEVDFLGHWPAEVMTVEHLLTHSTGIPDLAFQPDGLTGPDALADWAASLDWVGLHAPPGTFYNYSNPNFNLAGLVAERASGMEYRSYMEASVFAAAGLSRTTFDPAAVAAGGNASHGHIDDGQGGEIVYAPDEYDNGPFAPAGYAYSTAGDVARWTLLLSDGGGDVLSAESAAAMQAPQRDMKVIPGMGYGYGVFVEPFYDLTIRQHGGNIWGWGAFSLWHPESRFSVVVLANTFQSLPSAAYCIADHVLEPDHSVNPDYPVDPERWRIFEGMYDGSVATGWSSSPYPIMGEVVAHTDEQMLLHLWADLGHWTRLWFLDHQALDLFYVDVNSDGLYDFDVSFLTSEGSPEQVKWLRMRPIVGYPQLVPREGRRLAP